MEIFCFPRYDDIPPAVSYNGMILSSDPIIQNVESSLYILVYQCNGAPELIEKF
jgi:hypothetical protein